jgi:transcriptional regulator with XRE-family HTH domain
MQDEQKSQNVQRTQLRRIAARDARRRWADEVKQALEERGLTINAAAKQIGISPGRLQAWLSQDVEPSPRVMEDLAKVIGRHHIRLMQLLDWLPTELGDVPLRLEATEKLQEAMAEAQRWIQGSSGTVGLRGGSLVESALLEASNDWEVLLRHSIRGIQYPVRHSTFVSFSRVGSPDRHAAPTAPEDTAGDRAELMSLIQDTMLRTSAHWLPPERFEGREWPKRRDLVLSVPVLGASKPRGLLPNLVVPPSIVVVGGPFTGSQDVGALLAGTLDWSYFELAAAARERFGLAADSPSGMTDRAQAEVARRLLEMPESAGRLTVWSYSALQPILQTFRDIDQQLPLVILLRAPESLLELATQRLGLAGSPDLDLIEIAQTVARRTLLANREPNSYLILDVPELSVEPGHPEEADRFFDAHVELAFHAAQWLHDQHGGPPLDDTVGLLGELWSNKGAPPGRRQATSLGEEAP